MMTALLIKGLTKGFADHPVLHDLNLEVAPGQLVAILGASGSGKTTLLRLLCGFEQADNGTITLGERMVAGPGLHLPPNRRQIGYVAQEGALFPHLSIAQNVLFGLPRRQRRDIDRARCLLRDVGLPASYATRAPHQLSGGEQQRVALARALAPSPRLVLLDEPFSALDAALRADTRQAVAAALTQAGATTLLVTHDQAEALSMGDLVAVLRQGRLVQVASPNTLYRFPVDAELACFVGEAIVLPGVARPDNGTKAHVICALGNLPLADGMPAGEVDVLVRPEQVRLDAASGIRARVLDVTFYGSSAIVHLSMQNADTTVVTARVHGHAVPRSGEVIGLLVDGEVTAWPRLAPSSRQVPA